MKITIDVIPHSMQRYPTVGDWYTDAEGVHIRVSKMSDARYVMLVAIHELVEWTLCQQNGVSQDAVDEFDKSYEMHRHPDNSDEPGDDPAAPYKREHCIATGIERVLAAALQVDWKTYEDEINAL